MASQPPVPSVADVTGQLVNALPIADAFVAREDARQIPALPFGSDAPPKMFFPGSSAEVPRSSLLVVPNRNCRPTRLRTSFDPRIVSEPWASTSTPAAPLSDATRFEIS